nr:transporter associated domain-containing protein [Rhodospirillum rubrum]
MEEGQINLERSVRQPLVVHESVKVLRLMEQLRQSPLQVAVVLDEYGSLEGIATPTDILEAIAGEFPDEDEDYVTVERGEDGSWLVEGWLDIRRISNIIGVDLVDEADRYSTLAGYILWQLGHLPTEGERVIKGDLVVEVVSMQGRSIDKVRLHFEHTDGEGA